jgi:DNA-binding PadR family transcriptional regulator
MQRATTAGAATINHVMTMTALTFQILLALADSDRHGYGIIKEIEEREGAGAAPSTGALYLALQRMERDGLIMEVKPPRGADDARRRYYTVTRLGQSQAEQESARLATLVSIARQKKLLTGEARA